MIVRTDKELAMKLAVALAAAALALIAPTIAAAQGRDDTGPIVRPRPQDRPLTGPTWPSHIERPRRYYAMGCAIEPPSSPQFRYMAFWVTNTTPLHLPRGVEIQIFFAAQDGRIVMYSKNVPLGTTIRAPAFVPRGTRVRLQAGEPWLYSRFNNWAYFRCVARVGPAGYGVTR